MIRSSAFVLLGLFLFSTILLPSSEAQAREVCFEIKWAVDNTFPIPNTYGVTRVYCDGKVTTRITKGPGKNPADEQLPSWLMDLICCKNCKKKVNIRNWVFNNGKGEAAVKKRIKEEVVKWMKECAAKRLVDYVKDLIGVDVLFNEGDFARVCIDPSTGDGHLTENYSTTTSSAMNHSSLSAYSTSSSSTSASGCYTNDGTFISGGYYDTVCGLECACPC